jgi:hypothetical protein
MLRKIFLAFVGAMTILPHAAFAVVALTDSPPTANIERICGNARSAALPESKSSAYETCIHDERLSLEQLRQRWTSYPAGARATCVEPPGVPISYVELQTCLEMQPGGSLIIGVPHHGGRF